MAEGLTAGANTDTQLMMKPLSFPEPLDSNVMYTAPLVVTILEVSYDLKLLPSIVAINLFGVASFAS